MAEHVIVDAILFDMDGTLIDSTPGVISAWNTLGKEYGFDPDQAIRASHGRRLCETLVQFCRIDEDDKLISEVSRFENEVLKGQPVALPGVHDLLNKILSVVPSEAQNSAWIICTSATGLYTREVLRSCNIPVPSAGIISSDNVTRGKPHPDPYLAAASALHVDPINCIVVEDAPSGLVSARAAGCKTLAVCTSHSRDTLESLRPDYIVQDLSKVTIDRLDGKLRITVDTTSSS